MQLGTSGYHILMLLSMVDGKVHPNEQMVITNYLSLAYTFTKNLDNDLEQLITMPKSAYQAHLQQHMDLFFANSTEAERKHLLQFAIHVIKADGKIAALENDLFNYLYSGWTEEE